MGMKQPGTDMAKPSESGGRKTSADSRAKVGMGVAGKDRGNRAGETGEREPKGSQSTDPSGQRKERIVGGVAMGKADSLGSRNGDHVGQHEGVVGEFNEGRKEAVVYTHVRDYGGTKM